MDSGSWTILEIVKLAVSALIPITVVGVGYIVSRATKRLEAVQWANQTVIERRLDIFQQVAPKVNRLLCFAIFVGAWKEIAPADAIRLKRETDEIMYVHRVLFSRTLFDAEVQAAYDTLSECFRRDLYITREELSLPGN